MSILQPLFPPSINDAAFISPSILAQNRVQVPRRTEEREADQ